MLQCTPKILNNYSLFSYFEEILGIFEQKLTLLSDTWNILGLFLFENYNSLESLNWLFNCIMKVEIF